MRDYPEYDEWKEGRKTKEENRKPDTNGQYPGIRETEKRKKKIIRR